MEDVVESDEVDVFGRILLINRLDVFQNPGSYVLELLVVLPLLVEYLQISLSRRRRQHIDHRIDIVALFTTQLGGAEIIKRKINMLLAGRIHVKDWQGRRFPITEMQKSAHSFL